MTDPDLVLKRLAFIETAVEELRRLARPECFATDVREARFAAYTLQTAIQAALDVASHIVSDDRLGEPSTNRQLFEILARNGWIAPELALTLGRMAGFRNVLVHGYVEVSLAVLRDVVEHRTSDLLAFAAAVRARVA